MDKQTLNEILEKVRSGKLTVKEALKRFKNFPVENIEFARIVHHRSIRQGQPEVIYSPGKTDAQIAEIAGRILKGGADVLISRLEKKRFTSLKKKFGSARYFNDASLALILSGNKKKPLQLTDKLVLVCTAGTSDIPIAEEAAITAYVMGCPVDRIYDIGVAGIHRVFDAGESIQKASVLIVVAGMEGALPSVIGGLVDKPVIAVPTSVGYGASFGGLSALLGMLNSCASGVTVVNIDNGFGAGVAAARIALLLGGKE
jgi:NCAIR mutase (PurE)-related protein